MRTVLKWIGIVLLALLGILLVAVIAIFVISNSKLNKKYDIQTSELTIPTDAESIAEGKRQASIRACNECHTPNFGGQLLFEDPAFGKFYTANLTTGKGGLKDFSPADWDRAVRHGVDQEGKPLLVMPSNEFSQISDEHLAMMIAYFQTLDPVDNTLPDITLGPLARVLIATGQLKAPVQEIDHSQPPPKSVPVEVSASYGAYMAQICTGCHKPDFSGGASEISQPGEPLPANLTPAGDLANWTQEDFINTLRTGVTPEGHELDPQYMPWPITTLMTDDELAAIWLYLSSLPAVETQS